MVKPALRTKSIGFKVSEEEYAGGPPLRSVQGWDSQMPPAYACGTTEEVPKAHGLKNISRQILVLHNIRQHLAHIIRVDDNVLALFLRSVKAQLIQHPAGGPPLIISVCTISTEGAPSLRSWQGWEPRTHTVEGA